MSKKPTKQRPAIKVPRGRIGRAVFLGGQVAAAVSAARSIREARAKGDRLALAHGLLSVGVLVVTALLAARVVREEKAIEGEIAQPLMLTAGK